MNMVNTPVDIVDLKRRLQEVVTFLEPFLPLANCHMVDFITENLWETVTPSNIRDEVKGNDFKIYDMILNSYHPHKKCPSNKCDCCVTRDVAHGSSLTSQASEVANLPNLSQFVISAKNSSLFSLSDLTSSWRELQKQLLFESSETHQNVHANQCMTLKKAHEVEMMTNVVLMVTKACKASCIIDIGSGKGYLSSMLALHYGLNVLGVDSSHNSSHGATIRTKKLMRVWRNTAKEGDQTVHNLHLVTTPNKSSSPLNLGSRKTMDECSYKQATLFVTPSTDLQYLAKSYFPKSCESQHLALVGLHTCGDLASTAFRIFSSNQYIKGLCIVGCCYNLLSENSALNEQTQQPPLDCGFPMSDFLASRQFILGRNARMLAAQSVERILNSSQDYNQSLDFLFYRALLQVLLKEKLGQDYLQGQVGRLAAKCSNFSEYVHKALNKLGLAVEVTDTEIEALYTKYYVFREQLGAFFMFRLILAPVIECIILLDRLLFLFEQGISDAHLVALFDPLVSPRCYGIVAMRAKLCP